MEPQELDEFLTNIKLIIKKFNNCKHENIALQERIISLEEQLEQLTEENLQLQLKNEKLETTYKNFHERAKSLIKKF
jgi:regulator of replication initiation timing